MRVIGESKTVDLSKKLTVEMTLGELAYIAVMIGNQSEYSAKQVIDGSCTLQKQYKDEVKRYDNNILYSELHEILGLEGVTD